jgi:hypothetical protein
VLDDNEARPPSIVAYLSKRNNVVLSHCYSSANVIEPREPHTCNIIVRFIFYIWMIIFVFSDVSRYNLLANVIIDYLIQYCRSTVVFSAYL